MPNAAVPINGRIAGIAKVAGIIATIAISWGSLRSDVRAVSTRVKEVETRVMRIETMMMKAELYAPRPD